MATLAQIEKALHNAHNAGDEEAARHLAGVYKSMSKQPEKSGTSRFLSGVGGSLLDAAGNVAELIPGVSQNNPVSMAGEQGLNQATGTAGSVGKFVGSAVPYVALPQKIIPSMIGSAIIGAATSDGDLKNRAIGGGAAAGGAAIGGALPYALKAGGRFAGKIIGELGTHTGGDTIIDAAASGMKGGKKQKIFIDYLRGNEPLSNIVDVAEKGKAGLKQAQREAYKSQITPIFQDKTVLNYSPIEDAINEASKIGKYKGHTVKPSAVNIANELEPIIQEWSGNPIPVGKAYISPETGKMIQKTKPGFKIEDAHTIEGLDALKKRIGDLYDSVEEGTPEKKVLSTVYAKVKQAIETQNPKYKNVMEKDQEFRNLVNELNKELSLSQTTTDSTALRKLLAIPRNNANTNYGNRVALAQLLEDNGSDNLMTMLNAAALNSFKPRGLGGMIGGGTAAGSGVAALTGNPLIALTLAATAAGQSPRLMGEAALKTGQLSRLLKGPYKNLVKPGIIGESKKRATNER